MYIEVRSSNIGFFLLSMTSFIVGIKLIHRHDRVSMAAIPSVLVEKEAETGKTSRHVVDLNTVQASEMPR